MQALLQQAEALREQLTDLIKADVDVFNKLMACYGWPKTTDEEIALRSAAIQSVLKEATEVPLACARACAKAIELSRIAADKGNLGVISDAGAAVMSAYGGLKSAALNVYINTGCLKDTDYAEAKLAELEVILNSVNGMTETVYDIVKTKL
jgi:formiminotetrahydrofolate cyclodeaminase